MKSFFKSGVKADIMFKTTIKLINNFKSSGIARQEVGSLMGTIAESVNQSNPLSDDGDATISNTFDQPASKQTIRKTTKPYTGGPQNNSGDKFDYIEVLKGIFTIGHDFLQTLWEGNDFANLFNKSFSWYRSQPNKILDLLRHDIYSYDYLKSLSADDLKSVLKKFNDDIFSEVAIKYLDATINDSLLDAVYDIIDNLLMGMSTREDDKDVMREFIIYHPESHSDIKTEIVNNKSITKEELLEFVSYIRDFLFELEQAKTQVEGQVENNVRGNVNTARDTERQTQDHRGAEETKGEEYDYEDDDEDDAVSVMTAIPTRAVRGAKGDSLTQVEKELYASISKQDKEQNKISVGKLTDDEIVSLARDTFKFQKGSYNPVTLRTSTNFNHLYLLHRSDPDLEFPLLG